MKQIYLDYNATTAIAPSVQEAMQPFLTEHYGNPSSGYALGRACQEAIGDARERTAALIGADPAEIVFTSGGTESNNLAIKGVMLRGFPHTQGHLVVSALEHASVAEPAHWLERLGFDLTVVPCDRGGLVSPEAVAGAIRDDTLLVSIIHASDEIGTIQPIREIASICRERGVLTHCDAIQSVGKIFVQIEELGVDLLTLSGHKFYAPKGIGALYVRRGVALDALLHGGGNEWGLRAGTENVASIVGMGKAALMVHRSMGDAIERMMTLRDRLQLRLREAIGPELTVNGEQAPRLPNTLSVNFPNVSARKMLNRIPEISASTGSLYDQGTGNVSPVLSAIGLSPKTARGTMRLSAGWYLSEEQIDQAAELLIAAWEALQI